MRLLGLFIYVLIYVGTIFIPAVAGAEVMCPGLDRLYFGPNFVTSLKPYQSYEAIETDACGTITELHINKPYVTKESEVALKPVKLPGDYALPGFHDAHAHLRGLGWMSEVIDLKGLTSITAIREKVAAYIKAHPDYDYYEGRGWDQNLFESKQYPSAQDLDGLSDKFISLRRVDGHATWVNTSLFNSTMKAHPQMVHPDFDVEYKQKHGGYIVRDKYDRPTGIFIDDATELIPLPEPDEQTRRRQTWRGMELAAEAGLTAVHDMGVDWRDLEWFYKYHGWLPVRVFAYMDDNHDELLRLNQKDSPIWKSDPPEMSRFKVMGVKLYADGALGSRGAKL